MAERLNTKKATEMAGLDKLDLKLRDFMGALTGDVALSRGKRSAITERVRAILGDGLRAAAAEIKDEATRRAVALGWPKEAAESFFAYYDPAKDRLRRSGALAGAAKQRSMVEWTAGPHPKSPRAKVAPGGSVAMSKAAMFEFGTTRMPARPAFRPAITAAKNAAFQRIANAYREAIDALGYDTGVK